MGQVARFTGWILIGIVTTLVVIGMLTVAITEGTKGLASMGDPVALLIVASFYLPGLLMLGLGWLMRGMDEKDEAIRAQAREERLEREAATTETPDSQA